MLTVHQWQLVCLVILFYYRWWKKFCSPILYRVWYISGGVGFQLSWDVAAMAWDAKSFAGWNRHHQDDTTSCVPFSRGAPKTNVQFLRLHTVFWASGIPHIKQETPLAWNHEPITALANTWQSQKRCEVPYIWHHTFCLEGAFFKTSILSKSLVISHKMLQIQVVLFLPWTIHQLAFLF